jgi:hypothetical protein
MNKGRDRVPLVYRLDREARVIVAAGYGTLTDDDVFGYQRQIGSLEEAIGYDELVDMTHVTHIALPSTARVSDLAALAAGMDPVRRSSKFAIVAPDDLAFGLGRMFQTRRELERGSTTQVGVFRTMDDALRFLGVDHSLVLPTLR